MAEAETTIPEPSAVDLAARLGTLYRSNHAADAELLRLVIRRAAAAEAERDRLREAVRLMGRHGNWAGTVESAEDWKRAAELCGFDPEAGSDQPTPANLVKAATRAC